MEFAIAPPKGGTRRTTDVYVFCVLGDPEATEPDPLDLDQWEFSVLGGAILHREAEGQKNISIRPLERLVKAAPGAGPVRYDRLRAAIERLASAG